jgi:tetratricopeptide (TPR) repeat protein
MSARSLSEDIVYALLLGEIAGQRGNMEVATQQYLEAARLTRDAQVAERATRVAVYAKQDAAALEAAEMWVEVAPDDLDARQVLAELYVLRGQPDAAMEHMKYIVSAAEGGALGGYLMAATLLTQVEDKDLALRLMDDLLSEYPPSAEGRYAYAVLAAQKGVLDAAKASLNQAVALRPDWAKAQSLYARILFEQGERDRALSELGDFVQAHPNNVPLRLSYARMLVEARRNQSALEQFQWLLGEMPDNAEVLYAVALLSLHFKDLDGARTYFDRLLAQGAHEEEATYYRGQVEELAGNRREAIEWYERITQGDYYVQARVRASFLYGELNQPKKGALLMQRLRNEFPDARVRLYLVEGELLREAGRYAEAMEVYNRALAEFPSDSGLLYARGLLAEKLDRLDILERDLLEILEHDPDHPDALNALGYTLADRTSRYQEASLYIGRALELKPNDAAVIDSMGWLQFRLGNYPEAVRYLRQALELVPDAEIAAHLGEVLWVMGERDAARLIWEEALERDPDSDVLHEVVERLQAN